jgi:hypothetical protein
MIKNDKECNNEEISPKINKEPKVVPHHTWVSLIFLNFLTLSFFCGHIIIIGKHPYLQRTNILMISSSSK